MYKILRMSVFLLLILIIIIMYLINVKIHNKVKDTFLGGQQPPILINSFGLLTHRKGESFMSELNLTLFLVFLILFIIKKGPYHRR